MKPPSIQKHVTAYCTNGRTSSYENTQIPLCELWSVCKRTFCRTFSKSILVNYSEIVILASTCEIFIEIKCFQMFRKHQKVEEKLGGNHRKSCRIFFHLLVFSEHLEDLISTKISPVEARIIGFLESISKLDYNFWIIN